MTRTQPGSRAAALRSAVEAWRALPVRARKDAEHFFRDEAKQSDAWAAEALASFTGEERRHREDAAALRAAVKLLREAGRSK